jgi:hypothetical protein
MLEDVINNKGEGCICLHLFTTGHITRHSLAVVNCVCLILLSYKKSGVSD